MFSTHPMHSAVKAFYDLWAMFDDMTDTLANLSTGRAGQGLCSIPFYSCSINTVLETLSSLIFLTLSNFKPTLYCSFLGFILSF